MNNLVISEGITDFKTLQVGQIVAHNYRTADVFKKYNIDFCCGGKISLHDVCTKKNVDESRLVDELITTLKSPSLPSQNFDTWELGFLCDYIVNTHHHYVRVSVGILNSYLQKLVKVHGERHTELSSIQAYFSSLGNELLSHMEKEENVLFPYIKEIAHKGFYETPPDTTFLGGPINCMEQEHDHAGKLMHSIYRLTDGYTPPGDACTTYRVCFMKLKEFQEDLMQHIHLENNILFPKAMAFTHKEAPKPSSAIPVALKD